MSVDVVIPWRHTPDRKPLLDWVLARWRATFPGWSVEVGECPPGPWVKARAVADALSRCHGPVVVVADADVWCDGVARAVEHVAGGGSWAVPHFAVHRLSRDATAAVLAGGPVGGATEQDPYAGVVGGGMVVVRRDVYDSCPLDPRFGGWGQEDQSWGTALTALHGRPLRGPGPLWHLWHEPQQRVTRFRGSMAGWGLWRRYQAAAHSPAAMAALLREFGVDIETREIAVSEWVYRNTNTGDEARFTTRRPRLDNLSNWELIAQPEPVVAPVVAPVVPQPRTWVDEAAERLDNPTPAEPVAAPAPEAPKQAASKADWLAHAKAVGVDVPDGATKAQIIQAVRAGQRG